MKKTGMKREPKRKRLKKRVFRSWLTSAVSISMVLLMLGTLALILINAGKLSDYVREKIGFTLVLHDNLKEVEITRLQKVLNTTPYVKTTEYIDKEKAARQLSEQLGEDFTGFLGYNPLFSSLEVRLLANYTTNDSLMVIEKEFLEYPEVKEVFYQKDLVDVINQNVNRISIILLIVSGLLTFIFITLINNTIRISIYSDRFIINTMQLVGATRSFVRRPFLLRGVYLGIYGGLIANSILLAAIFSYQKELSGIINLNEIEVLGALIVTVIVLGVLISWLSTFFAVNKFLKMKFDELFY
ncbi:MAG TPA: permease-like cell division protein FtsX [Prolixibacteraceae bacterium]|nr:permease-like cell division protein FtsX [Prolixibacteraceae bacterium]